MYEKLPRDIAERFVLVLDPMLATGGTIITALDRLVHKSGVPEDRIVFVNLVACPEGINAVLAKFPLIRIVTAEIDPGLNEKSYIVPGLGDFGCRYFGTVPNN